MAGPLLPEQQEEVKKSIARFCVFMHVSLVKASKAFFTEHKRHYYVTPSCYIDLLRTFSKIFEAKKLEFMVNLILLFFIFA